MCDILMNILWVKIWVIQNERGNCVDQNEMTMEEKNEEDEKFEIHPYKDVIKQVSFIISS